MPDIRDLPIMTMSDAEAIGFASFGDVPHKVMDLPDGAFTLSVRTSDGRRVTFGFQGETYDGPARSVDIRFHDRGSTIPNADGGRSPSFDAFGITQGGRHIVDTRALTEEIKPSVLVLLLDTKAEDERRLAPAKAAPPLAAPDSGRGTPAGQVQRKGPNGTREVAWSFGIGPTFAGITDDTTWNGFLNVSVDTTTWPYVLRTLLAGADGDAGTIAAYEAMTPVDGYVSLACGFATVEVDANWRREFPDYPPLAMPPIPAGWHDESWHNDTAPSFSPCSGPMGEASQVWIDYPDPASREISEASRFSLCRRNALDETTTVYHGDDYAELVEHAAREALACGFAKRLAVLLSAEEWRDMRVRNRTVPAGVCASHDFIDANMVMFAAWENERASTNRLLPRLPGIERDFDHVNAAWAIATSHYPTSCSEGARFDEWRTSGRSVESLVAEGQELGAVEGHDCPGRIYDPGFMEATDEGWMLNIGNSSRIFADLAEAEAHLWSAYAASETRTARRSHADT